MLKINPSKAKKRKWIGCSEPGCRRRAAGKGVYCGEHQEKFDLSVKEAKRKKKEKAAWKKHREIVRAERAAAIAKKQSSRLLKAHCEKCNYTIRLSRMWIEVKRPMCPVCMKNMVTEIDLELMGLQSLKLKGDSR